MLVPEILRWAAVTALTAAVVRFPRPTVFWSHGARGPLVLARAAIRADCSRQSAPR